MKNDHDVKEGLKEIKPPNSDNISLSKVAVIGCGAWGRNLARNFHHIGALAAVCDSNDQALVEAKGLFPVVSRTLTDILSDDGIPAVVIAAPAAQHYPLARQAILAGKHVFVEKPLALRVPEAEALCELAKQRGRMLMVGHLLRYHPAFLKLQDICREGQLGGLRYIYSNRLNLGKIRTEENILWSFAPHDISMILALIGGEPESVFAVGHSYLNREVTDVTTTHLSFSGGQAAHIHVSWLHPFKEQRLVVIGEKGMAVFDDGRDWSNKLHLYPHQINWENGVPQPDKADAQPILVDEDEPLKLECKHFLDCIETGQTPRTDAHEGLRVLRVLDAAQRSMETGKTISFTAQGSAQ